jgi:hypothetical protein
VPPIASTRRQWQVRLSSSKCGRTRRGIWGSCSSAVGRSVFFVRQSAHSVTPADVCLMDVWNTIKDAGLLLSRLSGEVPLYARATSMTLQTDVLSAQVPLMRDPATREEHCVSCGNIYANEGETLIHVRTLNDE